jgi:hypothetical protein
MSQMLLLPLLLSVPAADAPANARELAALVAPYLEDRTVALNHIDLAAFDVEALVKLAVERGKVERESLAEPAKVLTGLIKGLAAENIRHVFLVWSLIDVPENGPFVVLATTQKADPDKVRQVFREAQLFPGYKFEAIRGNLVGGSEPTLKRMRDLKPLARPDLEKALAGVGPGFAQLVLAGTTDMRKILEEIMPMLPPELGGGSIQVLSRGLQWAGASAQLGDGKLAVRFQVVGSDADAAKGLLDLTGRALKIGAQQKPIRDAIPGAEKLVAQLTPRQDGNRLVLELDDASLAKLIEPLVRREMAEAGLRQSQNNLKQIGLALHNYHDAHGRFPAYASFDKQQKPLLSWRVHLLPYLVQDNLYKQFKLDEPWDSEHNKKLIAKMPAIFQSTNNPKLNADGKTTYLAPRGDSTMFPNKQGLRIADVVDGTSNTIFLVDADDANAVIWTKPDDWQLNPKQPRKGLSLRFDRGFLMLFVDGSVRILPKTITDMTLNAVFTRNGGEVIDLP